MKRELREKWRSLSGVEVKFGNLEWPQSLCHFCKYASWSGSPCSDSSLDCGHKLDKIAENAFEIWEGSDCWGFRPDLSWGDAVQYTSQRMIGEWPHYPRRDAKRDSAS